MTSFLFILGRKADLCFTEASTVLLARFPDAEPVRIHEHVLMAQLPDEETARSLQDLLGGTMKIARVAASFPNLGTEALERKAADIVATLIPEGEKKITFGIGEFGR